MCIHAYSIDGTIAGLWVSQKASTPFLIDMKSLES